MRQVYKGFECEIDGMVERIMDGSVVFHECQNVDASMRHLFEIIDDWEERGVLLRAGDDCPECGHTITTMNDGDQWRGEGYDLYCPACHYMPDEH